MTNIGREFYLRGDVVGIARELLGKYLCTCFGKKYTSGIICETEAYAGITDRASHAFGGRRTARNEVMYEQGGYAYVYLCYGIHSLFNVVTNVAGVPHAVLIRGIIPVEGLPFQLERSGKTAMTPGIGIGPGKVSKLLGIHYSHSGQDLVNNSSPGRSQEIWIEDRGISIPASSISDGPRIGVAYAGEDACLPNRFRIYDATGSDLRP
jgi:DNA-3-methyladenine glycosylase